MAFAIGDQVSIYNKWKAKKRKQSYKTPTQILLNSNNEVVAIGNKARTLLSTKIYNLPICTSEKFEILQIFQFRGNREKRMEIHR